MAKDENSIANKSAGKVFQPGRASFVSYHYRELRGLFYIKLKV
jgi:hypothetical protein